ncbi:MAG: LPS export ABC transporter periplasmic protein LptC [Gemmatimonadaceae bacterium]|nr:LPS export ABC transporter periplasmic protein LptC [Gemmatimonadaceae bacterium]
MTLPHRGILLAMALCGPVACRDAGVPQAAPAATAADSADQVMFGVHFFVTDAGLRRAEVRADTALTYEENTRTELRKVNATFFTAQGAQNATLTSQQGTYNTRIGSMEARGDVVVKSTDGRTLTSPHLRFDPTRNEISSDSAFVLTEKTGRITRGIGFISDPDLNSVRVLKGAQSTGHQVTIPRR